ncbi:MAG: DUF937 domain-containing protein [Anaerolineae bacterium]
MDISQLISGNLGDSGILNQLGQSVGANPNQVQQLMQLGLPTLTQALAQNASTPAGAQSLANALDQHQDEPVDNLASFFQNVDTADGAKILQHVFGGSTAQVQSNLAQQTGLQTNQVSGLLAQLAPLLLGVLGKQKKEQHLDSSGVAGLLGSLMGQTGNASAMTMATQMLDSNKNGSILDEIGGFLGRLFGKR